MHSRNRILRATKCGTPLLLKFVAAFGTAQQKVPTRRCTISAARLVDRQPVKQAADSVEDTTQPSTAVVGDIITPLAVQRLCAAHPQKAGHQTWQ